MHLSTNRSLWREVMWNTDERAGSARHSAIYITVERKRPEENVWMWLCLQMPTNVTWREVSFYLIFPGLSGLFTYICSYCFYFFPIQHNKPLVTFAVWVAESILCFILDKMDIHNSNAAHIAHLSWICGLIVHSNKHKYEKKCYTFGISNVPGMCVDLSQ